MRVNREGARQPGVRTDPMVALVIPTFEPRRSQQLVHFFGMNATSSRLETIQALAKLRLS